MNATSCERINTGRAFFRVDFLSKQLISKWFKIHFLLRTRQTFLGHWVSAGAFMTLWTEPYE